MLLASRALRAHLSADSARRAALRPILAEDQGFFLVNSVFYVSVFAGDLAGAGSLARLTLGPQRSPEQQGLGRVLLAYLALAQGRWREARMELALAGSFMPVDAAEHRLLLTLAPFVGAPDSVVARERAALLRVPPPPVSEPSAFSWPRPHVRIHPLIRAYLLGVASARLGDEAARQQALRDLQALPDPTGAMALARGFGESVRAEAALRAGRRDEALSTLERGALQSAFVPAWTSPFVSQAYERWRRAELLRELGRHEEALRWYGTFGENSPYDLVYLGPALYWQGRLLEQRGDRAAARARFARFVELWKGADLELMGMVEDARRRMR
jgi:tetratricopeptide (TPR) repeat protein